MGHQIRKKLLRIIVLIIIKKHSPPFHTLDATKSIFKCSKRSKKYSSERKANTSIEIIFS